jgi:hypothetical protein
VLDRQHPIVIMAEAGREQEATLRLGRIGFDHIAGYVAGASTPSRRVWNSLAALSA